MTNYFIYINFYLLSNIPPTQNIWKINDGHLCQAGYGYLSLI